jgi:hypothetical protein
VWSDYKFKMTELKRCPNSGLLCGSQPDTIYLAEPGVYQLIFRSKLKSARAFQEWVFEEVLPCIRKTGNFSILQRKQFVHEDRQPPIHSVANQMVLMCEDDLHFQVVEYIRDYHPEALTVAGLGEYFSDGIVRVEYIRKGYIKGQPDLIILNRRGQHTGFTIEFKTPRGTGTVDEAQSNMMERLQEEGYKTLISSDYTNIVVKIGDYFRLNNSSKTDEVHRKLQDDYRKLEDDHRKLKTDHHKLMVTFNKIVKQLRAPFITTRRTKVLISIRSVIGHFFSNMV